jgi:diaminobutyrate-2-oxoglutarate transaminase
MRWSDSMESSVRRYCVSFPATFSKARNAEIWDSKGKRFLDFFSGAGALNYGHNHPALKDELLKYIADDGISHSLDMATEAKESFIQTFFEGVLSPRGLAFRFLFPGPTGTNAVEAAFKTARKATGRSTIVALEGGFHGMTLGALAASSGDSARNGAGTELCFVIRLPFAPHKDAQDYAVERFFSLAQSTDTSERPAAIVVETVQIEGGVNVLHVECLQSIQRICKDFGVILIVDEIQTGCGRTGTFFSFERAGLDPDIVCLSKSLSGYGLPMSLVLIKEQLDCLSAGQHSGTFRGNNLAFITAARTLRFWREPDFLEGIERNGKIMESYAARIARNVHGATRGYRGLGMLIGIDCGAPSRARKIMALAFRAGVLCETSGSQGQVLKIMPPLTIEENALREGLALIESCFKRA